jgi:hypothetical protein
MDDFNVDDIRNVNEALSASTNAKKYNENMFDPIHEVELLIALLLRDRITKITDDDYEDQLKQNILARMPEATFSELVGALSNHQLNSNISLEKLLSPFIPHAGDRVPLLDKNKEESEKKVTDITEGSNKEVLQALSELPKMLEILSKNSNLKDTNKYLSIKETLMASLSENLESEQEKLKVGD